MKRNICRFVVSALTAVLIWGCYPNGPDYTEDLDVVYTTYDKEFDFKSRSTYSMPDKIVVDVKVDNGDTTYIFMNAVFATPILASIEANMTALGWTRVTNINNADVVLSPAGVSSTTYFYSYWYDWYYGGYWGWYYPPYYSVSSYTTGSLIMVIADPSINNPINRSPTSWIGAMNGVLTNTYDINRVTKGIDQAFAQSPYLKTN